MIFLLHLSPLLRSSDIAFISIELSSLSRIYNTTRPKREPSSIFMPFKKASSETVPTRKTSVKDAVQRIHDMCHENTQRLVKLEEQFKQMLESVAQKNEEMDTHIGSLERQISEMRMKTTSKLEEDKLKFDQIKRQSDKVTQPSHALLGEEQVEEEEYS